VRGQPGLGLVARVAQHAQVEVQREGELVGEGERQQARGGGAERGARAQQPARREPAPDGEER
jgi:hypothetical protein